MARVPTPVFCAAALLAVTPARSAETDGRMDDRAALPIFTQEPIIVGERPAAIIPPAAPRMRLPRDANSAAAAPGRAPGAVAGRSSGRSTDDDAEDDEQPVARPGTLSTAFAKPPDPTPFLKSRSLGPHLSPDFTVDLDDRATVGLSTNTARLDSRISTGAARTSTLAKSLATSTGSLQRTGATATGRSRDFGGVGLSLEYRFGR